MGGESENLGVVGPFLLSFSKLNSGAPESEEENHYSIPHPVPDTEWANQYVHVYIYRQIATSCTVRFHRTIFLMFGRPCDVISLRYLSRDCMRAVQGAKGPSSELKDHAFRNQAAPSEKQPGIISWQAFSVQMGFRQRRRREDRRRDGRKAPAQGGREGRQGHAPYMLGSSSGLKLNNS